MNRSARAGKAGIIACVAAAVQVLRLSPMPAAWADSSAGGKAEARPVSPGPDEEAGKSHEAGPGENPADRSPVSRSAGVVCANKTGAAVLRNNSAMIYRCVAAVRGGGQAQAFAADSGSPFGAPIACGSGCFPESFGGAKNARASAAGAPAGAPGGVACVVRNAPREIDKGFDEKLGAPIRDKGFDQEPPGRRPAPDPGFAKDSCDLDPARCPGEARIFGNGPHLEFRCVGGKAVQGFDRRSGALMGKQAACSGGCFPVDGGGSAAAPARASAENAETKQDQAPAP